MRNWLITTGAIILTAGATMLGACDDGGIVVVDSITPSAAANTEIGETQRLTISGLDDAKAYRITLVVAGNVVTSGATGVFVDNDNNGAADAGASENIARIVSVNGTAQTGAKTVPAGSDDPANPSGVKPSGGAITLDVEGIGTGTVYPVVYVNGGASTFLEVGSDGVPTETYAVGGAFDVNAPSGIAVGPAGPVALAVDGTMTYTISGLDDAKAYRITLVVSDNVTVTGTTGIFVDNDTNGAADAGASENTAVIVNVNGTDQAGAKTVPAGTDDPSNPSGVTSTAGAITFTVKGVAAGTIHPVIYENGGASTFLEIGGDGAPIETYFVAAAVTVN